MGIDGVLYLESNRAGGIVVLARASYVFWRLLCVYRYQQKGVRKKDVLVEGLGWVLRVGVTKENLELSCLVRFPLQFGGPVRRYGKT